MVVKSGLSLHVVNFGSAAALPNRFFMWRRLRTTATKPLRQDLARHGPERLAKASRANLPVHENHLSRASPPLPTEPAEPAGPDVQVGPAVRVVRRAWKSTECGHLRSSVDRQSGERLAGGSRHLPPRSARAGRTPPRSRAAGPAV
jgi:hypothetical protein